MREIRRPKDVLSQIGFLPPVLQPSALAYTIGLVQVAWYLSEVRSVVNDAQEVFAAIAGFGQSASRPSRALLWKAVELACDFQDFRLAQELLAHSEIRTEAEFQPGDESSLRRNAFLATLLEAHVAWYLGQTVDEPEVQAHALRHAFGAFCEVGLGHARRFYQQIAKSAEAADNGGDGRMIRR